MKKPLGSQRNVEAFLDVNKWVNPKVINIPKERIKQVTVIHKMPPLRLFRRVVPVRNFFKFSGREKLNTNRI